MIGPSGTQYEIGHGDQVAVVTEVGAGLRAYSVAGRALIDGYRAEEMCSGARGQTLIPWPNRIRAGRYGWKGGSHQLDLTEPEKNGAIHGLTRWAPWQLLDHRPDRVRFRFVLHACPGWPFVLGCELDYTVNADGLTVRTTAENLGRDACPYGTGAHPYLHPGAPTIDGARVVVPARTYLPVDELGIPTGRESVEGTSYDLRRDQPIGDRHIDVAYTDLERDADGRARVRLVQVDGAELALWLDETYPYVEIFTGDTLPDPGRRRTGVGVEPMTCAPDAFNNPSAGMVVLEPGETHSSTWGIETTFEEG